MLYYRYFVEKHPLYIQIDLNEKPIMLFILNE